VLKAKTIQIIEVQDFDDLVQKTYGKIYSFQQQEGCKNRRTEYFSVPHTYPEDFQNDTIPEKVNGEEMGVSFQAWLGRDSNDIAPFDQQYQNELFWKRNFYPNFGILINDLHKRGLIEEGEYGIDIDW